MTRLQELEEENAKLRGELLINQTPALPVYRYDFSYDPDFLGVVREDDGEFVTYANYEWMANYADRLVEFANLPCLPKDLENLRNSNLTMAITIDLLKARLEKDPDAEKVYNISRAQGCLAQGEIIVNGKRFDELDEADALRVTDLILINLRESLKNGEINIADLLYFVDPINEVWDEHSCESCGDTIVETFWAL